MWLLIWVYSPANILLLEEENTFYLTNRAIYPFIRSRQLLSYHIPRKTFTKNIHPSSYILQHRGSKRRPTMDHNCWINKSSELGVI